MRNNILKTTAAALMIGLSCGSAWAWDLQDLLGKARESLGNVNTSDVAETVDGLFSNSDFDIRQLEGTWEVTGAAVNLGSDDLLSQIGGKTATTALEKKINPYYKRYGLTGSRITFDKEGNFTLTIKKLNISGTVTKTGKSEFQTTFRSFGSTSLSPMETFFERGLTGGSLSVMWDASRTISLMQGIASYVKIQSAQTIASLLSQYDNLYMGFRLKKVN